MAFGLTNANFAAKQGETVVLTATQVAITDGVPADDYFTVSTLPTYGWLRKSGQIMAVDDTFTAADITAERIAYENNGAGADNDTFGLTAYDSVAESDVSEETNTITVGANKGWAAICYAAGYALTINGLFGRESEADAYKAAWDLANIGTSAVQASTSTGTLDIDAVLATKNQALRNAHMHGFDAEMVDRINTAADRMYQEIASDSDLDEIEAHITSYGEFAAMDRSLATSTEWVALARLRRRYDFEGLHFVRHEVDPFLAVLNLVAAKLNA